jgi:hypothetical protein
MAQYALLIGTKNGKRSLLADGDPREIRTLFKQSDGEGYDTIEVMESSVGRSRRKSFTKKESDSPAKTGKPKP